MRFPEIVVDYMNKVNEKIGTDYKPFNYYGAPDAEKVIIAMGSVCETIEEVDRLPRTQPARRLALSRFTCTDRSLQSTCLTLLPETVKTISVLDRTKEPGSIGEPLYLDVRRCSQRHAVRSCAQVLTGRYGLGSKDTTPADIIAVYRNMETGDDAKKQLHHRHRGRCYAPVPRSKRAPGYRTGRHNQSCKFWGLGSDGTVGANKNSIKIIGDHTDMYAQGYFALRLQEVRRSDDVPPAFRSYADQVHLLHLPG